MARYRIEPEGVRQVVNAVGRYAQDRLTKASEDTQDAVSAATDHLDPMSPLRWTCKSADKLAEGLRARGHVVSERTVNRLLHDLGYSLQSNRKTIEGKGHPDRDAQFQHINRRVKAFQRQGQPVVSVDTKEGACGAVPQRRAGVAAEGEARESEGP